MGCQRPAVQGWVQWTEAASSLQQVHGDAPVQRCSPATSSHLLAEQPGLQQMLGASAALQAVSEAYRAAL